MTVLFSAIAPPVNHRRFRFTHKHIGLVDDVHTITLDSWMSESGIHEDDDLLLQMDIEGFEYPALASLSPHRLQQFRFIIVEFHRLYLLWSKPSFELMDGVFRKLLQTHACVHIHPNNCAASLSHDGITIPSVMEFTVARRNDTSLITLPGTYPHPLDRPNNAANPETVLPKCWQR